MALPFFRKNKDTPVVPASASSPAAAPAVAPLPEASATQLDPGFGLDTHGIVVEEGHGAPQSALDEAAIQYASGHAGLAEATLRRLLDSDDARAWHLLFDLLGVLGREAEFEHLALDYAVRFETSPPVWHNWMTHPARVVAGARFELPGLLSRSAVDVLAAGIDEAPPTAAITLDFSRVELVDEGGADAAARQLEACRVRACTLTLIGVERVLPLLADLTRATQSRPAYWKLLLILLQWLGREADFENTAVDYAVHFEVSPPSWVDAPCAATVAAGITNDDDSLCGELTPGNEARLRACFDAAADAAVRIDLSRVTRIDYSSMSPLIGLLMEGLAQGRTVTFAGHNALIDALFRIMGIDQLATLEPRRPV